MSNSSPLAIGLPGDDRTKEIRRMCNESGFPEMAETFIYGEATVKQVRDMLFEAMMVRQNGNRPLTPEMAALCNPSCC